MQSAAGLSGRRWARSVRTPDQEEIDGSLSMPLLGFLDRQRCRRGPDVGSAQAGSAIGAVASFATTWLTQHAQERAQRFARTMSRRDHLDGDFIEEASRLFADALTLEFDEPSKFVRLYALIERLRFFASAKVRQPLKFPGVWLPFKGARR